MPADEMGSHSDESSSVSRTLVILDGLGDPSLGQELSSRWAQAGFKNGVDVAGQWAWLSENAQALTEEKIDQAATIAGSIGLTIRDRAGKTFVPVNDLEQMRRQIVFEYRSRLATTLVFGIPALTLHYVGRVLACGRGDEPSAMAYPWLIEMMLVAWTLVAAGAPIIWQAALSLIHLRLTADLLSGLIIAFSFLPSAIGVLSTLVVDEPWFGANGPSFHASLLAVVITVLARWQLHHAAPPTPTPQITRTLFLIVIAS